MDSVIERLTLSQILELRSLASNIFIKDKVDIIIWYFSPSGEFLVKSLCFSVCLLFLKIPFFFRIWSSWIPTRISFYVWQVLPSILLVDATIIQDHIPFVSRCLCCLIPNLESIDHLLINSDSASHVWRRINNVYHVGWAYLVSISGVLSS